MAVVIDDIIDQIERTGECIIVNKALRKIPNKIFECVDDVTVLDLSNNKLDTLPTEIGKLVALKRLDVKRNSLSKLPDQLGECMELEDINLQRNYLVVLPNYFSTFSCLRTLNLSSNPLRTFPDDFSGLKSLVQLDLSNCELASLPLCVCTLSSLRDIRAVQNNFKSLPDQLRNLKQLVRLDVSQCASLESLPPGLGTIISLTTLEVTGTNLTTPPKEIVSMGVTRIKEYLRDLDQYCLAVGKGLSSAVAGEPSIFSIRSKLANGENRIAGGDKFIVSIKAEYKCTVCDNMNGTYDITYVLPWAGPARISVTLDGQHIKGSPFNLDVAGVVQPHVESEIVPKRAKIGAKSREELLIERVKDMEADRKARAESAERNRLERIKSVEQSRINRIVSSDKDRDSRSKVITDVRTSRVSLSEKLALERAQAVERERSDRIKQADEQRMHRIKMIDEERAKRIAEREALKSERKKLTNEWAVKQHTVAPVIQETKTVETTSIPSTVVSPKLQTTQPAPSPSLSPSQAPIPIPAPLPSPSPAAVDTAAIELEDNSDYSEPLGRRTSISGTHTPSNQPASQPAAPGRFSSGPGSRRASLAPIQQSSTGSTTPKRQSSSQYPAQLTPPPQPTHRRRPSVEALDRKEGYVSAVVDYVEEWQKANTDQPVNVKSSKKK